MTGLTTRYEVLHYPGDVEEAFSAGDILGHDELGRPYAVLDAELEMCPACDTVDRACPSCHGDATRTTVHLGYATPDQLRTAMAHRMAQVQQTPSFASFRAAAPSTPRVDG